MIFLQISPKTLSDSAEHAAQTIAKKGIDFDSTVLAALIGAIVSLLVWLANVVYERCKASRIAEDKKRKKLIYFAAIIKPVISYTEHQVKNINAFADEARKKPYAFPLMRFPPKNNLERIVNKIDEEPFFNAFTAQYLPFPGAVKTFREITSLVQYQERQMNQILEMTEKSQHADYERKIKFKNHLKLSQDITADAMAKGTFNAWPEIVQFFTDSLATFLADRTDPTDIKYAHDHFVQPVMMGIVQRGYYTLSPIILDIANHLHNATDVYQEIKMQINSLADDFETISDTFAKSASNLKEASQHLIHDFFDTV